MPAARSKPRPASAGRSHWRAGSARWRLSRPSRAVTRPWRDIHIRTALPGRRRRATDRRNHDPHRPSSPAIPLRSLSSLACRRSAASGVPERPAGSRSSRHLIRAMRFLKHEARRFQRASRDLPVWRLPSITVAVFRSVTALQLSVARGLRHCGYMLSPPSGRSRSGGQGCQAGGVVVPAGAGLVASAPCWPAELEGEAGEAEEAGFPVAGEAVDAGGFGGGQCYRGDAGRAGLAAAGGERRGAGVDLQVSGAGVGLADGGRGGCGRRAVRGGRQRRPARPGWRRSAAGRGRSARCAGRARGMSWPGTGPSRGRPSLS